MAMSVGGGGEDKPMSEINTTPLVGRHAGAADHLPDRGSGRDPDDQNLHIPIMVSSESKDKVENLLLSVATTDALVAAPVIRA
jgi:biopolymer transport protein ExbD